jgi:hypothetical protein
MISTMFHNLALVAGERALTALETSTFARKAKSDISAS